MIFLSDKFLSFIRPDADRLSILKKELADRRTDFSIIQIDGKNHVYVHFPRHAYNPAFKTKIVLVHYDRAPNTPGANDNSAAVFAVLEWITRLNSLQNTHNIRIFFTDGEELGTDDPAENKFLFDSQNTAYNGTPQHSAAEADMPHLQQGAFGLADRFRKLGIIHHDVIVIDGCGRGDTLVISSAGIHSQGSMRFKKQIAQLYKRMISLAKRTAVNSWITAPVPYSDNAGFIASGVPAVAVTILPKQEAAYYMQQLQQDEALARNIMTHSKNLDKTKLPATWNMMHTENDTPENLTMTAFELTGKFLDALAQQRTPI